MSHAVADAAGYLHNLPALVVANVAVLATVTLFIIREVIARRREARRATEARLANVERYYYEQYLCAPVKDSRNHLRDPGVMERVGTEFVEPANRLSIGLQRVGLMAFLGAIPLHYAFMMSSHQFVADWVRVHPHVRLIRGAVREAELPYERRHGEWLALLAAMWIRTQAFEIRGANLQRLEEIEAIYGGREQMAARERALFKCEARFAGLDTRKMAQQVRRQFARIPTSG